MGSIALVAACSGGSPAVQDASRSAPAGSPRDASSPEPDATLAGDGTTPERVDPRDDGLEITLGEWAITPESDAIRPGKVTFLIHNRGTVPHGFEIELEGDSSGHGSGDLFKAESRLLQPGDSTRMTFDLAPAVYKIECLVDGHDDMGMEDMLTVRADAPLVKHAPRTGPDRVAIADFAFAPSSVHVEVGTEITWRNDDPTDHTVTSMTGAFGSDALGDGESFAHRFTEPGTFAYRCAIHPDMKGKVKVE